VVKKWPTSLSAYFLFTPKRVNFIQNYCPNIAADHHQFEQHSIALTMYVKTKHYLLLLGCILSIFSSAQSVQVLSAGTKSSFRGLSVVDDQTLWVSGSAGTVGRSIDGGQSWQWLTVKGYEKTDFRDIEAFDAQTAIIMGIASPAYILKTTDAGLSWTKVYENRDTSMFLDAMDFVDAQHGIVIGDPLQGRVFMAQTADGGNSWQEVPLNERPAVATGEAFFASSGTNVRLYGPTQYALASGGKTGQPVFVGQKNKTSFDSGKRNHWFQFHRAQRQKDTHCSRWRFYDQGFDDAQLLRFHQWGQNIHCSKKWSTRLPQLCGVFGAKKLDRLWLKWRRFHD
jgi:hypothetical protein